MITFFSKSLVSLAIIAALWGPTNAWLGNQQSGGLTCRADFSACRVAGTVIPLVDRATVLGQIADEAKRDPAGRLGEEVKHMATSAYDGVLGGVRTQVRKSE
jgi:hypothetical protein